jgi:antirestriction protein
LIQTRQNNNPPQHSLPKRRGWNDNPIGKCAKAARAEETKATKEAKAAEKQRKEAEAEAVKEKLAQMEADESFVQAQEQQRCIHVEAPWGLSC